MMNHDFQINNTSIQNLEEFMLQDLLEIDNTRVEVLEEFMLRSPETRRLHLELELENTNADNLEQFW